MIVNIFLPIFSQFLLYFSHKSESPCAEYASYAGKEVCFMSQNNKQNNQNRQDQNNQNNQNKNQNQNDNRQNQNNRSER